ncbi:TBC1 domain family member 15-like [Onthophagus taurus]|uniref:TBC1 domain family member 15-like n=1 Tax=Onthophagus taurus TaxID=166361 RepID=UPI000C207BE5|nr:TBC1 domain family member 15-like [Onthophagus taurus]
MNQSSKENANSNLQPPEGYPKVNELFCQDGISFESGPASQIKYLRGTGTLFITMYENGNSSSLYVEWKPLPGFTTESDAQAQEWTVVNTIEDRTKTSSTMLLLEEATRSQYLKIKLSDIKSYKLENNHRKLTFNDGSGEPLCSFSFKSENCDYFHHILKQYIKTAPIRRDKNHFEVIGEINEAENQLKKTLNKLSLFPGEEANYMWYLLKNFSENSSTTITMQGECKIETNFPKLPNRKDFPRSHPLTEQQWNALKDCHGRIVDIEKLKIIIFQGGVTPELRTKVWKYLLNYFDWNSTQQNRKNVYKLKEAEYFKMKNQWMSMSEVQENNFFNYQQRKNIIEKDINRTDRYMDFYAGDNNPNLQKLHDILLTYVMYNFDLGYVQGMSDLLSPILYLMQSEMDAFWCFAGFIEKVKSNFDIDQAGMTKQLQNLRALLEFIDPEFLNYLDTHESGNMFFCFRWLLVWFKRDLEMDDIMRLWEVLWTGLPCKNFHLLISVGILLNEKSAIIERNYGFTEILKHTNELSLKLDVNKLINDAEGIYCQIKEATHSTNVIKDIVGLPKVEDNRDDSPTTNWFCYIDDDVQASSVYK